MKIDLQEGKNIFRFRPTLWSSPPKESKVREAKFIRWLDDIKKDAQVLFLMGDLLISGTNGNT